MCIHQCKQNKMSNCGKKSCFEISANDKIFNIFRNQNEMNEFTIA
jgi:hypothetical protein